MTVVAIDALNLGDARRLTDEVKADAAALWAKLLRLYEGGAHTALGYSSWAEYCEAEFDMGKSRAYQLLNAGRVADVLGRGESTNVDSVPNEAQAREMVPLSDDEAAIIETWREAQSDAERSGARLTAKVVRNAVNARLERAKRKANAEELGRRGIEPGGCVRCESKTRFATRNALIGNAWRPVCDACWDALRRAEAQKSRRPEAPPDPDKEATAAASCELENALRLLRGDGTDADPGVCGHLRQLDDDLTTVEVWRDPARLGSLIVELADLQEEVTRLSTYLTGVGQALLSIESEGGAR